MQTELATLAYPQIGSILSISSLGEPVIDRLGTALAEGFRDSGPFSTTVEYFYAIGQAAIDKLETDTNNSPISFQRIGARVFCDIVSGTALFTDTSNPELFPLLHMEIGTQNILVDDDFNIVAIIDFEFAQTAP